MDRGWRLRDPCGKWNELETWYYGRGFKVNLRNRRSYEDRSTFEFTPQGARNGEGTFTLASFLGETRSDLIRFCVTWRYTRGRHIDEAEDDFVNICINEGRTIRKRHGRLYCTTPGRARHRVKRLK